MVRNLKELIIRILRNIIGLVSNKSQDPPFLVVVYTMGKVGSSTLAATLRKVLKNRPVFHVHFLSKEWIELNADIEWHQKNINNANRIKAFIRSITNHLPLEWYYQFYCRDSHNVFYISS